MVMVEPEFGLPASKMQVSCANGKLSLLTAPPLDVAHTVEDQLPLPARFQYLSAHATNVIPLFPLQSPNRVPLTGAAAPAIAISLKSMSVRVSTAPQVSVRVVPIPLDVTKVLMVALVPAESVRVPLMVWSADRDIWLMPAEADRPATVRLLKVPAPLIVAVTIDVPVKLTL